jgi:hypothetical protein
MHVLLVPRKHKTFSLETAEDSIFVQDAICRWADERSGKPWLAFEHANAQTGCGITHAHVHLVGTESPVDKAAIFVNLDCIALGSLSAIRGERQELLWCVGNSFGPSAILKRGIRSQLARRQIAEATGVEFSWDWRVYSHEPWFSANVQLVRRLARAWSTR